MPKCHVPAAIRGLAAVVLAGAGIACGEGDWVSKTSPPPSPTPEISFFKVPQLPPPPPLVFANLRPGGVVFTDLTVERMETVTVTADWTDPSNNVDLQLTETKCTDASDIGAGCDTWGRASGASTKPERMSVLLPPGVMRLWITNRGPERETVSVTVVRPWF